MLKEGVEAKGQAQTYQHILDHHSFSLTLSAFILIILFSLFCLSPLADVQTIAVQGNVLLDEKDILSQTPMKPGDSIFDVYWNRNRIEHGLERQFDLINQASLNWTFWNEYIIRVEELEVMGQLTVNGQDYFLLEDGSMVDEQPVELGDGVSRFDIVMEDEEKIDDLMGQIKELDPAVLEQIETIKYQPNEANSNRLVLEMTDGNRVIASIPSLAQRLNYYPLMVEAISPQTGEFNLETGAYFTPYSQQEDETSTSDKMEQAN